TGSSYASLHLTSPSALLPPREPFDPGTPQPREEFPRQVGSRLPMANLGVGYTQRGARAFMTERMHQTMALGTEGGSEPGAGPASGFESFFLAEHVRLYRALYVITGST